MPTWREATLEIPLTEGLIAEKNERGQNVRRVQKLTTEFDSTNPDQMNAMIEYLLHPLEILTGDLKSVQRDCGDELRGLERPEIDEKWRVQTVIWNHHLGMNPRINMFTLTLSHEDRTASQDVHKTNE